MYSAEEPEYIPDCPLFASGSIVVLSEEFFCYENYFGSFLQSAEKR